MSVPNLSVGEEDAKEKVWIEINTWKKQSKSDIRQTKFPADDS
jgi:hypothetical protein